MLSLLTLRFISPAHILRSEDGQGLTEYALILALIVLVSVVGLSVFGGWVSTQVTTVGSGI